MFNSYTGFKIAMLHLQSLPVGRQAEEARGLHDLFPA